jgi:hypothetical protein
MNVYINKNFSFLLLSEQKAKISTSLLADTSWETKKNHESVCYCICLKTVVFESFELCNNKNEI